MSDLPLEAFVLWEWEYRGAWSHLPTFRLGSVLSISIVSNGRTVLSTDEWTLKVEVRSCVG